MIKSFKLNFINKTNSILFRFNRFSVLFNFILNTVPFSMHHTFFFMYKSLCSFRYPELNFGIYNFIMFRAQSSIFPNYVIPKNYKNYSVSTILVIDKILIYKYKLICKFSNIFTKNSIFQFNNNYSNNLLFFINYSLHKFSLMSDILYDLGGVNITTPKLTSKKKVYSLFFKKFSNFLKNKYTCKNFYFFSKKYSYNDISKDFSFSYYSYIFSINIEDSLSSDINLYSIDGIKCLNVLSNSKFFFFSNFASKNRLPSFKKLNNMTVIDRPITNMYYTLLSVNTRFNSFIFNLNYITKPGFFNFIGNASSFVNSIFFYIKQNRLGLFFQKMWLDRGYFFPLELSLYKFFFLYYSNFFYNFFETNTFFDYSNLYKKYDKPTSPFFKNWRLDKKENFSNFFSKKNSKNSFMKSDLFFKNNNVDISKNIVSGLGNIDIQKYAYFFNWNSNVPGFLNDSLLSNNFDESILDFSFSDIIHRGLRYWMLPRLPQIRSSLFTEFSDFFIDYADDISDYLIFKNYEVLSSSLTSLYSNNVIFSLFKDFNLKNSYLLNNIISSDNIIFKKNLRFFDYCNYHNLVLDKSFNFKKSNILSNFSLSQDYSNIFMFRHYQSSVLNFYSDFFSFIYKIGFFSNFFSKDLLTFKDELGLSALTYFTFLGSNYFDISEFNGVSVNNIRVNFNSNFLNRSLTYLNLNKLNYFNFYENLELDTCTDFFKKNKRRHLNSINPSVSFNNSPLFSDNSLNVSVLSEIIDNVWEDAYDFDILGLDRLYINFLYNFYSYNSYQFFNFNFMSSSPIRMKNSALVANSPFFSNYGKSNFMGARYNFNFVNFFFKSNKSASKLFRQSAFFKNIMYRFSNTQYLSKKFNSSSSVYYYNNVDDLPYLKFFGAVQNNINILGPRPSVLSKRVYGASFVYSQKVKSLFFLKKFLNKPADFTFGKLKLNDYVKSKLSFFKTKVKKQFTHIFERSLNRFSAHSRYAAHNREDIKDDLDFYLNSSKFIRDQKKINYLPKLNKSNKLQSLFLKNKFYFLKNRNLIHEYFNSSNNNIIINKESSPEDLVKKDNILFRMKPGYSVLWRQYRKEHRVLASLSYYRQRRMTNYFLNFKKNSSLCVLKVFEFSIFSVLKRSGFFFDYALSNFFLKFGFVFVNGLPVHNRFFQLYVGDRVQLVISFTSMFKFKIQFNTMYYFRIKFLNKYIKNFFLKTENVEARSRLVRFSKKWFRRLIGFCGDTPNYLEVDFMTMTCVIIYEPFLSCEYDPSLVYRLPYQSMRLYNWKYVN